MGNFERDLQRGIAGEKLVEKFFESQGWKVVERRSDNKYDLLFMDESSNTFSVEVKKDELYSKTGNVAIEFYCSYKRSGVSTSKADVWCYVLGDEIWAINKQRLQRHLTNNYYGYKVVSGGDGGRSQMFLLRLASFKELFKKIN